MPNWCHNTLIVTGEPADLDAFAAKVRADAQPLTFHADVPLSNPETATALQAWGTKWDACFHEPHSCEAIDDTANPEQTIAALGVTRRNRELIYKFDTAWSPPEFWLAATVTANPDLDITLRWGEVGVDSAGEYQSHNGQLVHNSLPITDVLSPEEMWF